MAINTEHFSDTKAIKAHLGFLFFIVLDLLTKDATTLSPGQSAASIFIAAAIPSLIISLLLLPEADGPEISRGQFKFGGYCNLGGHLSGIVGVTCIFISFNVFAGILFLITALTALLVLLLVMARQVGWKEGDTMDTMYDKAFPEEESAARETEVQESSL